MLLKPYGAIWGAWRSQAHVIETRRPTPLKTYLFGGWELGPRRFVTLVRSAVYKSSYLLTYLLRGATTFSMLGVQFVHCSLCYVTVITLFIKKVGVVHPNFGGPDLPDPPSGCALDATAASPEIISCAGGVIMLEGITAGAPLA